MRLLEAISAMRQVIVTPLMAMLPTNPPLKAERILLRKALTYSSPAERCISNTVRLIHSARCHPDYQKMDQFLGVLQFGGRLGKVETLRH